MPDNPDKLLSFAQGLADAAAEISLRYFRQRLNAENKADASPVTVADREIEQALRTMIAERYPNDGIYGEEFERTNPQSLLQWVIDPIDGTRAFMAGYPTFTTLIALCENGVPVLGVIDQPVMRERWSAISPFAPHHPPLPAGGKELEKAILDRAIIATTSVPYYFTQSQHERFNKLRAACAHTIIGGDGYGYAMLASGHIDLMVDDGLKPYDFCALVPVIQAAGGVITDWQGKPLTLSSQGDVLAAGNPQLHAQALGLLHD